MNIYIPYNENHLDVHCDFVIQTTKQLVKKNNNVYLILKYFPLSLGANLKKYLLKHKSNDEKVLRTKFSNEENKFIYFIQPPQLFPKILKNQLFQVIQKAISVFFYFITFKLQKKGILWCFDPDDHTMASLCKGRHYIIYDCVDFFSSLDKHTHLKIKKDEKNLINSCLLIFANSHVLSDYLGKKAPKKTIIRVPQGFDLENYSQKAQKPSCSNQIEKDKRKKITLIGTLTYRIDFDLLFQVVKKNNQLLFLIPQTRLICEPDDSVLKTDQKLARLKTLSNIFWLPPLSRPEIKSILSFTDICIIPYDVKFPFNKNCFPMKIFEYFYMGKPVISTPITELKYLNPKCITANNSQNWHTAIITLLKRKMNKKNIANQKALAINNSWENKIDTILSNIYKKIPETYLP